MSDKERETQREIGREIEREEERKFEPLRILSRCSVSKNLKPSRYYITP